MSLFRQKCLRRPAPPDVPLGSRCCRLYGRSVFAIGAVAIVAMATPSLADEERCITSNTKASYQTTTFPIHASDKPGIKQFNATISLIGDIDSKSFGVSYRASLTPAGSLRGDEKLILRLYTGCEDGKQSGRSVMVGSVSLAPLKSGEATTVLIGTSSETALVPFTAVACIGDDIELSWK